MEGSDGGTATVRPPIIGIHHTCADRAALLASAVTAAGFRVMMLPPPVPGGRVWRDSCFDLLAIDPHHGPLGPRDFTHFARGIAPQRPLLILSDRDCRAGRTAAIEAGADDAVGWSDDPAEVVARIAGLLRRCRMGTGQLGEGEIRIDLIDRRVERAGRLIRLPLREFDLLANLARVPGRPVSRTALLKAVWRIDFDPGTNRVEVHMSRLRAKVDHGFAWPMLHTIKGQGYALVPRRGGMEGSFAQSCAGI